MGEVNTGAIGLYALAGLFIVLKLTGQLTWPWVWVVSPLWIPVALFVLLLFISGLVILYLNVP